jgi:hypothetical protein
VLSLRSIHVDVWRSARKLENRVSDLAPARYAMINAYQLVRRGRVGCRHRGVEKGVVRVRDELRWAGDVVTSLSRRVLPSRATIAFAGF